jgi:hypothetical protein
MAAMDSNATSISTMPTVPGERRRTFVALFSASIISLVVWALIVVLKVH